MSRLAVIDLGSNTFHLLIAEKDNITPPYFKEIYRKREFVYLLGEDEFSISTEAQARALQTISEFKDKIKSLGVAKIVAIGTAAFRMAQNGDSLKKSLEHILESHIEVIEGQKEARLIYKGAKLMSCVFEPDNLLMDIGGGSVEFVHFRDAGIQNSISIKAGISYLRNNYLISDPLKNDERVKVFSHLDRLLTNFANSIVNYSPSLLLGTSGPFEILEELKAITPSIFGNDFNREEVLSFCKLVNEGDLHHRLGIKGMPATRADLSKESFLLMEYVLLRFEFIQFVRVGPFGLKEGIIAEYLNLE